MLDAVEPCGRRFRVCTVLWLIVVCLFIIDVYLRVQLHLPDREGVTTRPVTVGATTSNSEADQGIQIQFREFRSPFEKRISDLMLLHYSAKKNCPNFVKAFKKLVWQYYPRLNLSTDFLLRTRSEAQADTCGEEHRGSLYGQPWYRTGFVVSRKCNHTEKLPVSHLVTIVLLERIVDQDNTVKLLEDIRSYNKYIPIILGTMASSDFRKKLQGMFNNLTIVECDRGAMSRHGKTWNSLIKLVDTPYTLVARNIFYFDDLARLERQIYVISSTSVVGVAGGAFRNETGFWKVGCFQSRIRNYVLKYTPGYKYSALDCMLCDYLEGPFIVKTSIVQRYRFRSSLFAQVLFEDWFLQLKQANILVLNCPDVLYFKRGYVEGFPENEKNQQFESWLSLARRWEVDRIDFPSRGTLDFTCEQLNVKCNPTASLLIRTCCITKYTDLLRTIDSFAKQMNVEYEIVGGTVLGAVKLGNILPWDLECSISYEDKYYDVFYNNSKYFDERGFKVLFHKVGTVFKIFAGDVYYELFGERDLSSQVLPSNMRNISTRIKVNGLWMKSVWNPGLYVRNRYGPKLYKHAEHWIDSGKRSSWDHHASGLWQPCRRTSYHGCLDQYPTDGSEEMLPDHLTQRNTLTLSSFSNNLD